MPFKSRDRAGQELLLALLFTASSKAAFFPIPAIEELEETLQFTNRSCGRTGILSVHATRRIRPISQVKAQRLGAKAGVKKTKHLTRKPERPAKTQVKAVSGGFARTPTLKLAKGSKSNPNTGRETGLTKSEKNEPFGILQRSNGAERSKPPKREAFPEEDQLENRFQSFAALFSSTWGEFAWDLYQASDTHSVQKIFKSLPAQGFDSYLDDLQYEFEEATTTVGLRRTRTRLHQCDLKLRAASKEYEEAASLVREGKAALVIVRGGAERENRKNVVLKLRARRGKMWRARRKHTEIAKQLDEIYEEMKRQRAYLTRAEILKFTASKRRGYTPENLAMAVAGLPHVSWRQSASRCRKFDRPPVQVHYRIFDAVRSVLRRTDTPVPVEFVMRITDILKEWKPHIHRILGVGPNREAFQRACQECATPQLSKEELPYRIAAAFSRNLQNPMNALDRVLAAPE